MTTAVTNQFNIQIGDSLTHNVEPLLNEIRHALHDLIDNDETAIIDLRSIPLAPGEEDKILEILGRGEVTTELDSLGRSEIIETSYTGVWLTTHYNEEGDIISRFIEVTTIPDILRSPREDIYEACDRLDRLINNEETIRHQ